MGELTEYINTLHNTVCSLFYNNRDRARKQFKKGINRIISIEQELNLNENEKNILNIIKGIITANKYSNIQMITILDLLNQFKQYPPKEEFIERLGCYGFRFDTKT